LLKFATFVPEGQ